ncbi:hypothetical protein CCM_02205 [Cordyceps militaris CM01]|uniref:Uncharacterized protein n=1 Tax=Cordyceps militaris (strain CM01) TaxID=983644 RepID=G3J8E5_CORMM|nr:uncharacterized protein CCM_02205 [Cordyceps militaris CM01]EGX93934.1 hypothetical protein CCM_02205 [Cordyceps militaris CM01]
MYRGPGPQAETPLVQESVVMESLQLSQVLADLSNLGAAEPQAAAAIVNANVPIVRPESANESSTSHPQQQQPRPPAMRRHWSTEPGLPKFDKLGRRILISSPNLSRPSSNTNSIPGTPRGGGSDASPTIPRACRLFAHAAQEMRQVDDDLERASTLMALYDIRAKIKQQDNSSLIKAREKINALAAKQQAQQVADRNAKAAEEARKTRYSFPRSGL